MAGGKIGVVFALVMFHFLHPTGRAVGRAEANASLCLLIVPAAAGGLFTYSKHISLM